MAKCYGKKVKDQDCKIVIIDDQTCRCHQIPFIGAHRIQEPVILCEPLFIVGTSFVGFLMSGVIFSLPLVKVLFLQNNDHQLQESIRLFSFLISYPPLLWALIHLSFLSFIVWPGHFIKKVPNIWF